MAGRLASAEAAGNAAFRTSLYSIDGTWHLGVMILYTIAAFAAADQAPPVMAVTGPPPPPPMVPTYRTAPPKALNAASWVTTQDYPARSMRNEEEGTVGFRLKVDPSGMPSACDVTTTSGYPMLDTRTCELLMLRARFTPAKDTFGDPIVGVYANRVRWVIPVISPPEPGLTITEYVLDEQGLRQQCYFSGGDVVRQPEECDNALRSKPYRNKSGTPVRRRVTIREQVTVSEVP